MGTIKAAKALFLITLVLMSSACSVKFAYNNMDRFVRWQVNDYLDLDAEQRAYFKAELAELIRWHRTNHLPLYSDYIRGLAVQYSDGVSEAQVEALFDQFMLWGEEVEERGMPIAIELMRSLSDEQVAKLPERLEESNLEWAEDEAGVPLEDVQIEWANDFVDVMSRFTGRLDRQQKAYIKFRATAYQPEMVMWADYRRRWQADMLKLLEYRNEERFAADFRALAKARESYYGPEYTAVSNANIALGRETVSYVLSNLNERQARRFTESLEELAQDLSELSTQGAGSKPAAASATQS